MEAIIVKGTAEEIAALVLAIQGRRAEDVGAELEKKLHQEIKNELEVIRSFQESR